MRHGVQVSEVKAILSFIAVTPDLDQVCVFYFQMMNYMSYLVTIAAGTAI